MIPLIPINPFLIPPLPDEKFFRPPLLYDIMQSIVNYGNEEKVPISKLSSVARETIFDFNYPLSDKVNKEEFETLILDKFINRRLAYTTYTSWKIALKTKMFEIMPKYNKLFDSFSDWNIFKDGETGTREKQIDSKSEVDSRYSKLPQNEIEDVKNGTYMTDYTLGQNESGGKEKENYSKTNTNKMEDYLKFLENENNIMTSLYKELDSLFYQIANF